MTVLFCFNLYQILKDMPWINGWNETYAYDFCTRAIMEDNAGKACRKLPNVDFNSSIENCVQDIQVSVLFAAELLF